MKIENNKSYDYDPVAKFYLHHSDKSKDFSLPKGVQTIPGAPSRVLTRLEELRGLMLSFELLSMQPECSCLPQCQSAAELWSACCPPSQQSSYLSKAGQAGLGNIQQPQLAKAGQNTNTTNAHSGGRARSSTATCGYSHRLGFTA